MKKKRYEILIDEQMQFDMKRVSEDGNLKWSGLIRNFIKKTIKEEDELAKQIAEYRKKFN